MTQLLTVNNLSVNYGAIKAVQADTLFCFDCTIIDTITNS